MSLPSNTVVEQVMNSSSFQIEQCPVCLHVSLLHGVCRWRQCYTRDHGDYRAS